MKVGEPLDSSAGQLKLFKPRRLYKEKRTLPQCEGLARYTGCPGLQEHPEQCKHKARHFFNGKHFCMKHLRVMTRELGDG
jgi:hypothetical protein